MRIRKRTEKKKSIVQPEELLSIYSRMTLWVEKNYRAILVAIAAVLIIGAVAVAFGLLRSKQNREAATMEADANRLFTTANPLTDPERKKADFETAAVSYQRIIDQYPRSKSAAVAQYYVGNSYRELQNWSKAIAAYQAFIKKYPRHPLLPSVYLSLGYTYVQTVEYVKAISIFQKAADQKSPLSAQAAFEVARSYELSNDPSTALTKYEVVKKDYPGSPWAQEAVARLNQVKGQKAEGG